MDFRELLAYKKAFSLAMNIFEISKDFLKEERYSLTDQIRRSSRSTCANIAEAYRKRMYPKHFKSKLSYSDGENSETTAWIEFSYSCDYIDIKTYKALISESEKIGKLLNFMIHNPSKFGVVKTETAN